MQDKHENTHRDWRIPDALWERIAPLLPHPSSQTKFVTPAGIMSPWGTSMC